ncbi:MFS transporter [Chelativorans sp. M5D2P16]|uniref:MFS transporter n=1 Tax=Chelativorans sp. M5D2P16 TaxID=3095678 RepID=UPI002ACAAF5F|nr:MFS transporter [Chelativorans sp. M5D2P16]MDZ5699664.1 MFS transporter [Chelativorans sp. M5D2P16]
MAIIAQLGALLLSATILLTGNGLQTTLLPLRAEAEAFPALSIGFMGSSYFIGFVVGCLTTAHLVRPVGHIRVFTAMVAIASVVPLLHILTLQEWAWWILRAVTGYCIAALFLVIESWLNERADNTMRGTVFSVYTTLTFVAIICGQILLTFYEPTEFTLFAVASIVVSLAAVPIALTSATAPAPLATVRLHPIRLVRLSPAGAVGCFAVGLVNGAFWSLAPIFASSAGFDATGVATFIGVAVLGGALSQWPFGRLSDRLDRRAVILLVSGLSVATGLGLFLASRYWSPGVLPLAFAFGAFSFPVYAISVAHVNDLITTESFVEVSGGLLLLNGVGSVLGPVAGAFAMRLAGPGALFAEIALVYVLFAAFILLRMRDQARPAETHSADFVPAVDSAIAAPVGYDPRSEETPEPPLKEPEESIVR